MNSNKPAKSFNPIQVLDDKNNYQKFILVEKDGKAKTRIILSIPDIELREQIICNHFLSRYVQIFIEEDIGVRFISRDKPWDFELELSNSEKLIIEITAIADEVDLFKTFKYQERITQKSNHEYIEFHELVKLNTIFPSFEIEKLISTLKQQGINKDMLIANPHYKSKFLFQSRISDDLKSFNELMIESIRK
ncbi:hypothetical protein I2I05_07225 [Hymenobacter sp. BT683]|uniref:Uncharacterized protein n=1 Tax=Hymenobacter jeongseonensis TaxID=2791027 RepID=A0ABS0IGM0_9BACT|nr:hypothetical protein [Hymenobacter jeongseonensis]MBF9237184.1 hypothetical protein [Hymenobacter jeongseonensis]